MADQSTKTTDHQAIKQWAEARNGVPAVIKETRDATDKGILRIHFPDQSDDNGRFSEISWNHFFQDFDRLELAFLHSTEEGNTFHKFVSRN